MCATTGANIGAQWYKDSYFAQDRIYHNEDIGFSLHFKGPWRIVSDPRHMNATGRDFFSQLHASNSELLFMGTTADSTKACLGIAKEVNYPNRTFAEKIREANIGDIDEDYGLTPFIAYKKELMKWEYRIGGYHFVEFFFVRDTYNVRIRFWTKQRIFTNFLPVFETIMTSLEFTYGY